VGTAVTLARLGARGGPHGAARRERMKELKELVFSTRGAISVISRSPSPNPQGWGRVNPSLRARTMCARTTGHTDCVQCAPGRLWTARRAEPESHCGAGLGRVWSPVPPIAPMRTRWSRPGPARRGGPSDRPERRRRDGSNYKWFEFVPARRIIKSLCVHDE
jgi:hypothetical protein